MAGSFNDFLFRQDCTADGTLLARSLAVLGTSRVFGRNFYLGVASCVDITIHITVATDRTGMSGVASLGTGGRSYHSLIVMAGCLNCLLVGILAAGTLVCFITVYCTSRVYAAYYLMVMTKGRSHLSFTNRTGLGCGTGSFRAGSMAESGDGFSFRVTARSTGIGHQTCCSTGGFHGDNAFPIAVVQHRNALGVGMTFSTNSTAVGTGVGHGTFRSTGGGYGNNALIIAVAGSRDYFLSNQHFVTHGAVLAFGQAGSGTGGLHGGIHHFGMAEGGDFFDTGQGYAADGTLGAGSVTNGGTGGSYRLNNLFSVVAVSGDGFGIGSMTIRTGIGHYTIGHTTSGRGFFANVRIAQPRTKFGVVDISRLCAMLRRFNISSIGILQFCGSDINCYITSLIITEALIMLISNRLGSGCHRNLTRTRAADICASSSRIYTYTISYIDCTIYNDFSAAKFAIAVTAGRIIDRCNRLSAGTDVFAPVCLIIEVGIAIHITGGAFANDDFSIGQHGNILIDVQSTTAIDGNRKMAGDRQFIICRIQINNTRHTDRHTGNIQRTVGCNPHTATGIFLGYRAAYQLEQRARTIAANKRNRCAMRALNREYGGITGFGCASFQSKRNLYVLHIIGSKREHAICRSMISHVIRGRAAAEVFQLEVFIHSRTTRGIYTTVAGNIAPNIQFTAAGHGNGAVAFHVNPADRTSRRARGMRAAIGRMMLGRQTDCTINGQVCTACHR